VLIVDTHVHAIIKNDARYPYVETLPWVKTHAVDFEQLLERFDRAGVHKAVLVQALHGHAFDNSYTADCAARFPGRFVPMGMLNPVLPDAVETLDYWVQKRGIRGCRINPRGWLPNDPRTEAVWKRVAELGIPMDIQGGGKSPELPELADMIQRHPDVRVLIDHMASVVLDDGPPFARAEPVLAFAKFPNACIKFSTNVIDECRKAGISPADALAVFIERFGAERLLWGSNYPRCHEPEWTYSSTVQAMLEVVSRFPARDQALLMGGAAQQIWPELR
jgi:L-fuconolactonase